MKQIIAFTAGAVVGSVGLAAWAWYAVGPEFRTKSIASFKEMWHASEARYK